ncbi:MAG: hypothetical protein AAF892_02105 [Cyanobacteria bacterium P01_D01_bin.71]
MAIDSRQQAFAADIPQARLAPIPVDARAIAPYPPKFPKIADHTHLSDSYLDFDAGIADRLRHSDLLGPQLTRSRLTSAHLFPRICNTISIRFKNQKKASAVAAKAFINVLSVC